MIITILEALIAIPKIGAMIEELVSAISAWWVSKQTGDTLGLIANAAAMASIARTDEERFQAAEAWQKALKRPRYTK